MDDAHELYCASTIEENPGEKVEQDWTLSDSVAVLQREQEAMLERRLTQGQHANFITQDAYDTYSQVRRLSE